MFSSDDLARLVMPSISKLLAIGAAVGAVSVIAVWWLWSVMVFRLEPHAEVNVPTNTSDDDYSRHGFNLAAIAYLQAIQAEQDQPSYAHKTDLLGAEHRLVPWLLAYRAESRETAKNIAGFQVWVESRPIVNAPGQFARIVRRDPERLPDLENDDAQSPVGGFICHCGSLCAAKRGAICQGACGCPVGH